MDDLFVCCFSIIDSVSRYGPPLVHRTTFTLVEWASRPENKKAWQELQEKSAGQLTDNPFDDVEANFAFGDQAFRKVPSLSLNKARVLGWTGYVDTIQSLFSIYSELGELGMLPRLKVDKQEPVV